MYPSPPVGIWTVLKIIINIQHASLGDEENAKKEN